MSKPGDPHEGGPVQPVDPPIITDPLPPEPEEPLIDGTRVEILDPKPGQRVVWKIRQTEGDVIRIETNSGVIVRISPIEPEA